MLNKQIERVKNNSFMIGVIAWCVLAVLIIWTTDLPTKAPIIKESTETVNSYIEAISQDATKWKTVTVEEYNPDKSGSVTNEGLKRRTITEYYFDQRIGPKK